MIPLRRNILRHGYPDSTHEDHNLESSDIKANLERKRERYKEQVADHNSHGNANG